MGPAADGIAELILRRAGNYADTPLPIDSALFKQYPTSDK
jgi:hypothetical protein